MRPLPFSFSSSSCSCYSNTKPKTPLFLLLSRVFFCSLPIPKLKNLYYRHRVRALVEAQSALTDYLHSTRSLPFSHADLIASNSPFSLSAFVSQVPFPSASPADFPRTLRRFLSYRPVNEFEFFFESIGLPPTHPAVPSRALFLSDDPPLLAAVSVLARFAFPWTRLGLLYREQPSVFSTLPAVLLARLRALEARGLRRLCVIAVCLAFPSVLARDADPGGDVDLLLDDLTRAFVDFDLAGRTVAGTTPEDDGNVDVFLRICRRIRVFYDLGSPKGQMGELIGRNWKAFLGLDEAALAQKLNFFIRLGMKGEQAGPFLLQHPEIMDFDLENPSVAMPEYLNCIGLAKEVVASLSRRFPYVMGKNKLGNLPGSMRAMDLHKCFLGKIVSEGNQHYLSADFASNTASLNDSKIESDFVKDLERVKSVRKEQFVDNKVEFFLGIGFGENKSTTRAASLINGTKDQLQERFEFLLEIGIEYSMLCRMINATPKLLNQSKESLREKVNYLCNDLNCSLQYLNVFPAFLCFDLENRTKPRYKILNWLKEHGLLKKPFSPATVLANSEKRFVINLYSVHPAAPKQWLECFSSRSNSDGSQKNLFLPRPESRANC
ncbi:LOW QUALITY PROTEIN: transcription termination factor MTEF18, mitochondrial [Elaeis guineensis]|uniref:LOW QUALITY PROTEIN: transcription termination factor MTEF18, mitochondrial n=1 Tax=Elaeis guineensis var. tenera TaxID=51953 RepID=UPI003C6D4125